MYTRATLAVLCILLIAASARAQTVWYVDDDNCPEPGSGSEADPFCLIQDCIEAAMDGDDCVVAPGTYFENINLLGKAFTLRSTDGPDVTTIDANDSGTVVECTSGEGENTVLHGFTITHGNAVWGGGMYNNDSSPTVTNCTFSENVAGTGGGAMYNRANDPTLTNNIFRNNTATGRGGAMYNVSGGNPTLHDCVFQENSAQNGGAVHNHFSSSPVLTGCTFEGNSASNDGGGIHNAIDSNSTVTNCTFSENWATFGGGMYNRNSSPSVTDCTFSRNSATIGGGWLTPAPHRRWTTALSARTQP